jgi:DNA-binding protein HU-alpha
MAISKSATTKAKTAAKTAAAKPTPPRGIPAPSIKPADVVVPTMSIVDGGPAMSAPKAVDVASADAEGQAHLLKKQELVDRVVKASGAKKKDVKLIMEAALGVLGDALSAGEELNLPPLGKMKVNRQRDEGNAEVLILKLRRGGGKGGGGNETPQEALEQDDEDE